MGTVLARLGARPHDPGMLTATKDQAAAIRAAFEHGGEFSAAVEVRRLFPAIIDNAEARAHARIIAGWAPLPPEQPRPVTRLRPANLVLVVGGQAVIPSDSFQKND
jgi:hypothetical protein